LKTFRKRDVAANEQTGARFLFDRKRGIKLADVRLPSTSTNRFERTTIRGSIILDIPRITDEQGSQSGTFYHQIPRGRQTTQEFDHSFILLFASSPRVTYFSSVNKEFTC